MRVHVLSDLHLEFGPFSVPKVEADVVVLAGDTQPGKRGVQWALKTFPHRPVIYVLGNHDYYAKVMPRLKVEAISATWMRLKTWPGLIKRRAEPDFMASSALRPGP